MRAVFQETYGGPDVLQVGEQPDPLLGPDTVLVRVRNAGINPVDWKVREGYLQGALPHTLPLVPGWDAAGVVEAVGPAVHDLAVGDEVLGYVRKDVVSDGTYAELVSASSRHLALKPPGVSFEAAGALPLAGLTALQSVEAARVSEGDVVLVHAAAGGVGHLAAQLAVARGARVIGTASEGNHDFVRSLGAEPATYGEGLVEVVRALAPDGVDVALDYIGGESIAQSFELVKDAGRVTSNVDPAVAEGGGLYCFVVPDAAQLAELAAMVDAGTVKVEVQQTFALADVAAAHRLQQEGHVRGKLVLTV